MNDSAFQQSIAAGQPPVDSPAWQPGVALASGVLRRRCDPAQFAFETTAELPDLTGLVGQQRATDAIGLAVAMRHRGFNVFAFGPGGTGKHTLVQTILEQRAASEMTPSDWCYVNNFADHRRPRSLRLPSGRAVPLRETIKRLISELRAAFPVAFEREDYRVRHEVIDQQFKHRNEEAFSALEQKARARGVGLLRTPMGVALAPLKGDEVIEPEAFNKLPDDERQRIARTIQELQVELEAIIRRIPEWEREHREAVRQLNRETMAGIISHLLHEPRAAFADLPVVGNFLREVEHDILERTDEFLTASHMEHTDALRAGPGEDGAPFHRYQVNVLVDNGSRKGAPIVTEDHPTLQDLIGRVEHVSRFGTLMTDFNLIVAGALHRANGGYLVLDAHRLLGSSFGWDALKRALRAGEIRIGSLEQMLSLASTVSLEPEPIPLDVKVVLIGPPVLYYLLAELDPDFTELFKIAAEFDDRIDWTPENATLYAQLLASTARKQGVRPLRRDAVARTIEEAARLGGDAQKLSAHLARVADMLIEADHLAAQQGNAVIGAGDVEAASEARLRRSDRIYRRIQDEIARETLKIDTGGERAGQVNGLAVIGLGGAAFGYPQRITAQIRLGHGEVVDIEREVALSGPIHSKGVLILAGFLAGRFGRNRPLSLTASLVFEQSYGTVEGDSASAAELFALLSALADVPIRQSFAVTGSIDQHGHIQAVGGINEKIEGFFEICYARGLSGAQGVLIPSANVQHLMLRADVVKAVTQGLFQIIPIDTVDQGIALLTGISSGEPDPGGQFADDTLNGRVALRLAAFAKLGLPATPKAERRDKR